jgi:hypothetical protein
MGHCSPRLSCIYSKLSFGTYLTGVNKDAGLARAHQVRVRPLKLHFPRVAPHDPDNPFGDIFDISRGGRLASCAER